MPDDVVIIGGGPNGLLLACELALAGVRPTVLERFPGTADAAQGQRPRRPGRPGHGLPRPARAAQRRRRTPDQDAGLPVRRPAPRSVHTGQS
ncbi:MAG: FAD-dependent oxidoreductase [Actinophytocola sp.]|uniref:FAD-dependent oxidoreductase n=1 Tax=Actinophytocola sp. TaxID=1872138 RepID=UPI00132879C0|nr:FAD-dependent oxidoreductase [Actinophytocola sp.]